LKTGSLRLGILWFVFTGKNGVMDSWLPVEFEMRNNCTYSWLLWNWISFNDAVANSGWMSGGAPGGGRRPGFTPSPKSKFKITQNLYTPLCWTCYVICPSPEISH
jgi:hypothetical protein